nr:hypothetical protein [Candidatus Bathyarchaeota archaeon]
MKDVHLKSDSAVLTFILPNPSKSPPEAINFMAKHGRGLICLAIVAERLDELGIEPMVPESGDRFKSAFAVSVDA